MRSCIYTCMKYCSYSLGRPAITSMIAPPRGQPGEVLWHTRPHLSTSTIPRYTKPKKWVQGLSSKKVTSPPAKHPVAILTGKHPVLPKQLFPFMGWCGRYFSPVRIYRSAEKEPLSPSPRSLALTQVHTECCCVDSYSRDCLSLLTEGLSLLTEEISFKNCSTY